MTVPLVLIQARTASMRLPDKIHLPIGSKRMLDHVIDRVRKTGLQWAVGRPEDWLDVDEADVLGRFHALLMDLDPEGEHYDPIVRVTADCPMLDHGLVAQVLATYQSSPTTWALVGTSPAWDGLDVEVIRRSALARAHHAAVDAYDREHVTAWLKKNDWYHEISLDGPPLRWSVDDAEGLEFVRQVFDTCEHCRDGQPHRMRDFRPIWDIHDVYGLHPGGAPEPMCCEAFELLEAHTGGPMYVSR